MHLYLSHKDNVLSNHNVEKNRFEESDNKTKVKKKRPSKNW